MASPYSPNDEQGQHLPFEPPGEFGEDELRQQPHSEPPGDFPEDEQRQQPHSEPPGDSRGDKQRQQPHSELPQDFWEDDFMLKYKRFDEAIRANDFERLKELVKEKKEKGWRQTANLSAEPLLSVVIGYGKIELAMKLLKEMPEEDLMAWNLDGDTALHVAAANGEVKVVEALVKKCKELMMKTNYMQEAPLHKAALNGEEDVFWKLVELQSEIDKELVNSRTKDGSTVLHCAVMGNKPGLALDIAKSFEYLISSRNENAATPLQLLVTIPDAFRSRLQLGRLGSFIYDYLIPLDKKSTHGSGGDEEESKKSSRQLHDEEKGMTIIRDKFPPNYSTLFDLFEWTLVPAGRWIQLIVFNVLKNLSPSIQSLHLKKENHRQTAELIDFLASYRGYWDFFIGGGSPSGKRTEPSESSPWSTSPGIISPEMRLDEFVKRTILTQRLQSANSFYTDSIDVLERDRHPSGRTEPSKSFRWKTSPLIIGAEMGLDDFVKQILSQHPKSAYNLDEYEMNVLQVAIRHGHKKIVKDIGSMTRRKNPLLPSRLLSSIHQSTGNTILHIAAEKTEKDVSFAFQMRYELQFFEQVRDLMPKSLEYNRNKDEKTAQELFTEKHKETVKYCRDQLKELGKTCSSLVAAVVFASSFSIPGDKDANQDPVFLRRTAFRVFSHAYVIGLSSASASLVLFLSFLISSYKEQDFRYSIPIRYVLATTSFLVALVALLVAFSCNIYLQIYGGKKAHMEDIIPLVCELTAFPAVFILVLLYYSPTLGFGGKVKKN